MPLLELLPKVVVCAVVLWRMDARLRAVRSVEVGEGMLKNDMVSLNKREKMLGLMKRGKQSGYVCCIDQTKYEFRVTHAIVRPPLMTGNLPMKALGS